ncbi:MAG: zinc ABC transporter substrate-binding protein [Candidatus Glassbacteria bacterium]|nr:zinc ABC transporter substrate-binding protein [Candidatus Glassbacteria bacterium]
MRTLNYFRTACLSLVLLFAVYPQLSGQQHRYRHRGGGSESDKLKIVTSFADYAAIVKFITGNNAIVSYISQGDQDPHFVPPKPSFAVLLRDADMWVTTGMDLEQWATTLLDKARNKNIMDGEIGFVAVSEGIKVLQKVEVADRTQGDIHTMGNPHIQTGPLNLKVVAQNITIGLMKVDPANAELYKMKRDEYLDKMDRALFGDELVGMFGGETLCKLLENKTLFTFLEREMEGVKLIDKLGGWLKKALPFRGLKVVAYHKNWAYFVDTFGLEVAGYIEPKPGIPPSAKHVQNMIKLIKDQNIQVMLVATYFEKESPRMIENRTGIKAIYLPVHVTGLPEIQDSFQLIDYWIDHINANLPGALKGR